MVYSRNRNELLVLLGGDRFNFLANDLLALRIGHSLSCCPQLLLQLLVIEQFVHSFEQLRLGEGVWLQTDSETLLIDSLCVIKLITE